jgi:choline dehydrogenase-like flavoprotein
MTLNRLDDSGQPLSPPDVQRPTLSLDLMGRYVCNTWDEAVNNGGPPFDVIILGSGMFGGYCGDHLYRKSNLRILALDGGPFLVSTHLQNLPDIGLFPPDPIDPASDTGQARNLVWGMPWRGNAKFVGQAYCVGGKSLYWGGWCPTLLEDDLAKWATFSPSVAQYLRNNYPALQRQVGILDSSGQVSTDYIQGPLFDALKAKITSALTAHSVPNLDTCENAPLAVQGAPPASGLFPFDKYSSAFLLVSAVREAAGSPDASRRLFLVPNTHVIKLNTAGGAVTSIQASFNGARKTLGISPSTAVVLALGTIESTRLALYSFPRSSDPSKELMGRNLMVHVRDNMQATVKRSAIAGAGALPLELQAAALLVRGSTAQGKFHLQVTASADLSSNPDALLFAMIPDIDEIDGLLALETSDNISMWFRGVSESKGDTITPVPSPSVSYIDLSPYESDEFGVPRAYVQIVQNGDFPLADVMDSATRALILKLDPSASIFNYDRDAPGSTYHEAGTLWMGDDPATSVTDANGRFHHVSNAFCVDQSLFPTVGSVNPTLTGLVLTRKVAEAIIAGPR